MVFVPICTESGEPEIGELKKGDLSEYRVYKFKFKGQEYLVAYKYQTQDIIFYM